jgi:hypothetical protein
MDSKPPVTTLRINGLSDFSSKGGKDTDGYELNRKKPMLKRRFFIVIAVMESP